MAANHRGHAACKVAANTQMRQWIDPLKSCIFPTDGKTAAMSSMDNTNPKAHKNMRTLLSRFHGGREHSLAERFRIHLIGIYSATAGREWNSHGNNESDIVHHINVNLSGRRQVVCNGRIYHLEPAEAWFLPANTPVERRCEETCEILFFKFFFECLPGVDPLLDWKDREPRRMCAIDPAEWATGFQMKNYLGFRAFWACEAACCVG